LTHIVACCQFRPVSDERGNAVFAEELARVAMLVRKAKRAAAGAPAPPVLPVAK
jgi:hypothetical protein